MKQLIIILLLSIGGVFAASDSPQLVRNASLEEVLNKAEQGDVRCQYNLGVMYNFGDGVQQDYVEAVRWYTKAAKQGHVSAQRNLGALYYNGLGVLLNYKEAAHWLIKAAEQGDADGQATVGQMYYKGEGVQEDKKEAVKWWTKAAEQGNASSQFCLGTCYTIGIGVEKDPEKAVKYYTLAANQGDIDAQNNLAGAQARLGDWYYGDEGSGKDLRKAAIWYRKAAELGNARAQAILGMCYYLGHGVVEDYVEGYKWIVLAGMNGEDVSGPKILLQEKLSSSGIEEAQRRAREFIEQREKEVSTKTTSSKESKVRSFGSGFFASKSGLFITAAHVVKDAKSIKVYWQSSEYAAEKLFVDETLDLVILKVSGVENPQPLSMSSSSAVKTGDVVYTIGFPQVQLQGVEPKYTDGTVSSLSGMGNDLKYLQISVPVQPGNSGGPLLNSEGQVVGLINSRLDDVNTLLTTGAIPQNVNYALKSSFILTMLESLPDIAGQLEKPISLPRSSAIEKAKNAVAIVICY